MSKLFFTLLFAFSGLTVFAQSENAAQIQKDTDEMVSYFNLNADQAEKMQVIQARKYRNLAEITGLEATNRNLYLQKLRNIRLGTMASTERLLNPDQKPQYQKLLVEQRKKESALIKKLKAAGKTKAEIEQALLELEAE
jgi:hypothetical protein